ncbi:uracil-xanthine permease family protein [Gallaecimonas kandeliae]|uniref:uracil-xanthine permease family protein n=1 Tax=Gallaecimonas kandeliae TaxID=3029055 RepID=UPI0026496733|nr:uracil-xanthine permease family protein [Gallaecimonas kandeliae]WKE66909.1 uracil-xanthine permease family protein [Gallaecimonas kandeliae]
MTSLPPGHHRIDSLPKRALIGAQMLFVAFGALVLMPLLTGLDPNVAFFTAGLGTLLFQLITGRLVPVFLASSFAFIAPVIMGTQQFGLPATLGGLAACGLVYVALASLVKLRGVAVIERLLPPVVVGPIIIVIGLSLAGIGVNMAMGKTGDGAKVLVPAGQALLVSMSALVTTLAVATLAKGIFKLIPIIAGIVVGYGLSLMLGIVSFDAIKAAPWLAMPHFTAPEFRWDAILWMLPVALAPAIEHVGDVLAIGSVTGRDYLQKPGLHRTLLGDGLATTLAACFGGPPNTTYSEVTGAVTLTRSFDPRIMTWSAIFAIVLAFVGKLGAALQSIPSVVMGGIMVLLFGSIASVGINTLVRSRVDLSQSRNLVICSVVLVFGIGGMVISLGSFTLQGISLCALVAILLNLVLPRDQVRS